MADFLAETVHQERWVVEDFHGIKEHDRASIRPVHDIDPSICLSPQPGLLEKLSQKRILQRLFGPHLATRKCPQFLAGSLADQ